MEIERKKIKARRQEKVINTMGYIFSALLSFYIWFSFGSDQKAYQNLSKQVEICFFI
jgi:hypothetical protein